MPKKLNDGTPTANILNLLTYMFVNAHPFTLKQLSREFDFSKPTILRYFDTINRTMFGKIEKDNSGASREASYFLEINKDVITAFEKRKKNLVKKQEELKLSAEKSKEDKKIKDKSIAKKVEDQEFSKKKSTISKTKSAKWKKEEKWQKHQKTRPTKKNKK